MFDPPYAVWSIWWSLGWLDRSVLILLGGLIIYSLLAATVTISRIRSLKISASAAKVNLEASLRACQRNGATSAKPLTARSICLE